MDVETQIRAWKDPKFRASLQIDLLPNPAGERLVELNDDELRGVWGAATAEPATVISGSEGYVCSVSGECNGTGESCWSV